MNNIKDATQSRRVKMIVAAAIAIVVIFFVGIWAFSTAINSAKNAESDKNETADTSETKTEEKTEEKTEDKTDENTNNLSSDPAVNSPANEYTATTDTNTANQNTTTEVNTNTNTEQVVEQNIPAPTIVADGAVISNNIPSTGPADVAFSAVMVGVVVALIGFNIKLIKARR